MAISYSTLGSSVTINPTGAVVASQLNTSVAIVGGYDSANADSSVTAGEATVVNSSTEAANMFGADCELTYQTALAINAGADEVHGVPLPETSTTETFAGVSSGTLSNTPAMDPRVHPDHDITAQDTVDGVSVTVNVVYGTPTTPSNADTININPRTGAWKADSSSDYDITYTYGDFTTNAVPNAFNRAVRYVGVCTEEQSVKTAVRNEAETAESNFRFLRGVVGAEPDLQPSEISNYTPPEEDWRIVEIAPARGTSADGGVRTLGAILGHLARQPIDVSGSITYDTVEELTDLNVKYTPGEADDFAQVTAITDQFEVAEGVTTSVETSFRDIYKVEIIDFVVEQLYARVKDYRGGSNALSARRRFKSRLSRSLGSMSAPNAQPPLLATGDGSRPYTVSVTTGSKDTVADVDVGIEVAPIAKQVNLELSVGPISFNGASTS